MTTEKTTNPESNPEPDDFDQWLQQLLQQLQSGQVGVIAFDPVTNELGYYVTLPEPTTTNNEPQNQ